MDQATKNRLVALYRDSSYYVYKKALIFFRDTTAAHDMVQEVFTKVITELEKGNLQVFERAYLIRCTTNACIDRLRLRKPHDAAALATLVQDARLDERADARSLVRELLDRLAPDEVELAVLRFVDGCTMEELEQICGATRKTLARRLQEIRARAVDLLGAVPDGDGGTP